jgi:hypothetical protein
MVVQRLLQTSHRSQLHRSESHHLPFLFSLLPALSLSPLLREPPLLSSLSPVSPKSLSHGEAGAGGDRHLRQHHGGGRGPRRPQTRGTAQSHPPSFCPSAVQFKPRNLAESARIVADLVAAGRALVFGV